MAQHNDPRRPSNLDAERGRDAARRPGRSRNDPMSSMELSAADHHHRAAFHFEHAAYHHREAARHEDDGRGRDAAMHGDAAREHYHKAMQHSGHAHQQSARGRDNSAYFDRDTSDESEGDDRAFDDESDGDDRAFDDDRYDSRVRGGSHAQYAPTGREVGGTSARGRYGASEDDYDDERMISQDSDQDDRSGRGGTMYVGRHMADEFEEPGPRGTDASVRVRPEAYGADRSPRAYSPSRNESNPRGSNNRSHRG